jgi:hypothetical protein
VLNSIPDFLTEAEVHYTPLEKFRLERIQNMKREYSSASYYSSLALNAIECARKLEKKSHLRAALLQRAKHYRKIANSAKEKLGTYLVLNNSDAISYKEVSYYKTINARTRKLIEEIATKKRNEIMQEFSEMKMIAKSEYKKLERGLYNLVMLALLLQICVGDDFVTILPQNYYKIA